MEPQTGGLLALLLVSLLGPRTADAETAAEVDEVDEEQIEADSEATTYVTEVRAPPPGEETPQETRVRREQIERSPARSVAEVLEGEAGLFASTGSRGERLIRLRGFDQRQLFVVIDGVPAYLPYDGDLDLGKLPTALVEDVVVLRPPGSLRYGPGGMGGSLSIRTRQPGRGPLLSTSFDAGRGEHYRLGAVHSYRAGPASWLVGGGVESAEGFALSGRFEPTPTQDAGRRAQSDRLLRHLLARARLDLPGAGWVEATAWQVRGAWGIPPSTVLSRPRYWRVSDWRTTVATLAHRWHPAPGLVLHETAFVGLFDDLLDAYDDETYSTQDRIDSFHSRYHDLTAGAWARIRWAIAGRALLRLQLGARYESHDAHQLLGGGGEAVEGPSHHRALVFLGGQVESRLGGGALRLVGALETEIEAGLAEAAPARVDGMISLRYDPPEGPLSAGLSVARRSRIPTLKERFSTVGSAAAAGRLPNPALRPEAALHLGLHASLRLSSWLSVELSLFEAEVTDLIDLAPGSVEGSDQFVNVGRARQAGAELALGLTPWRWLDVEVGYGYLYAREIDEGGGTAPLAYRPEHLARLLLRLRPLPWLEVATAIRIVGPQQLRDPATHRWRELGVYVAWDAGVDAEPWAGIHTSLKVTNLLDGSYQTQYGFPEPGWQLWGGVRLEIERPR